MKSAIVKARPGRTLRLSKIDPGDIGNLRKEDAVERFEELRQEICELQVVLYAEHRHSLLIVFQAMDTGGKDGVIKDLCAGLNPAGLELTNFKAPSQRELDHDFLWRAYHAVPSKGMIGIWNRSYYEDVLITRVHKLIPKKIWKSRYEQINAFEKILTDNGTTLIKFMLHISKDEQKERLQARLDSPEEWWKFNPNDIKERTLWDKYQDAYEDAINRCSTDDAPWYVVPADHKWARNVAVAERVLATLKKIDPRYSKPSFDPKLMVID